MARLSRASVVVALAIVLVTDRWVLGICRAGGIAQDVWHEHSGRGLLQDASCPSSWPVGSLRYGPSAGDTKSPTVDVTKTPPDLDFDYIHLLEPITFFQRTGVSTLILRSVLGPLEVDAGSLWPYVSLVDTGNVWHRVTNNQGDLDAVSNVMHEEFPSTQGDQAKQAVIITWDGVGYHAARADKHNSFQLLLAMLGNHTYTCFIYQCLQYYFYDPNVYHGYLPDDFHVGFDVYGQRVNEIPNINPYAVLNTPNRRLCFQIDGEFPVRAGAATNQPTPSPTCPAQWPAGALRYGSQAGDAQAADISQPGVQLDVTDFPLPSTMKLFGYDTNTLRLRQVFTAIESNWGVIYPYLSLSNTAYAGKIWYRASGSQQDVSDATNLMKSSFSGLQGQAKYAVVITWDSVGYPAATPATARNSFQLVIAPFGNDVFTCFIYQCLQYHYYDPNVYHAGFPPGFNAGFFILGKLISEGPADGPFSLLQLPNSRMCFEVGGGGPISADQWTPTTTPVPTFSTGSPSSAPSVAPTTTEPAAPSSAPTAAPSTPPTAAPTHEPTMVPGGGSEGNGCDGTSGNAKDRCKRCGNDDCRRCMQRASALRNDDSNAYNNMPDRCLQAHDNMHALHCMNDIAAAVGKVGGVKQFTTNFLDRCTACKSDACAKCVVCSFCSASQNNQWNQNTIDGCVHNNNPNSICGTPFKPETCGSG